MLLSILSRSFDPDGTRSGWMATTWEDHKGRAKEDGREQKVPEAAGPESIAPSPSLLEEGEDPSVKPEFDPSNPFKEANLEETQAQDAAKDLDSDEEVQEVIASASSSGEDTTSDVDSDLNEEVFHKEHESILESGLEKAIPGDLMQNKRSRVLHKRSPDESNHLQPVSLCGVHGSGFICLAEGATFNWPKCSKCFKDEPRDPDLSEALSSGKRRKMS
eukprot:s17_g23.t1